MPGMVSPGPTAIRPRGPSSTAVSSNTSRTDQLAIPVSSMRGTPRFATVGGFAVALAFAWDADFRAGLGAGLAVSFEGGDDGVGCTTGWVFTGVAATAGCRSTRSTRKLGEFGD